MGKTSLDIEGFRTLSVNIKKKSASVYRQCLVSATLLAGAGFIGGIAIRNTIGLPDTSNDSRVEQTQIAFNGTSNVDFCIEQSVGEGSRVNCGFTDHLGRRKAAQGDWIICRQRCEGNLRVRVDLSKNKPALYKDLGMEYEPPLLWEGWSAYYGLSWYSRLFYTLVTGLPYVIVGIYLFSTVFYLLTFFLLSAGMLAVRLITSNSKCAD